MNKHNINIVMPMGGLGSRFNSSIPKPFIKVEGKSLYEYALDSLVEHLRNDNNIKLTVVYRWNKDYNRNLYEIDRIRGLYGFYDINIEIIDELTSGPVETCMKGFDHIDNDDVVIVLDCDLTFYSKEFLQTVSDIASEKTEYDGCLLTFESLNTAYSYVKEKNHIAKKLREKEVISSNAIAGAYCFSSGKSFKQYAKKIVTDFCFDFDHSHKETYMSWLCDEMINDGAKFFVTNVDYYYSLGTPDEVEYYKNNHNKELYISDLDGTLFNTKEANYLSYKEVFKQMFNVDLKRETYDECFGLRIDDFLKKLNIDLDYKYEIKELKSEIYEKHISDIELNVALFSELVKHKEQGNLIALATTASSKNVYNLLRNHCITSLFDIILTGEDVDKGKPDPEIYIKIMRKENVLPKNTYIYEDSETGIKAAIDSNAGGVIHIVYNENDFKRILK